MSTTHSPSRNLAYAVARAFSLAGLSMEERFPQTIAHTGLPWAVPPLMTHLTLADCSLQDLFDFALPLDLIELRKFWEKTLVMMYHTPSLLFSPGCLPFNNLSKATRRARTGYRLFRFAQPPGWGDGMIEETAGIQLSLEVAHAVRTSCATFHVEQDDSNYWVETLDGQQWGVMNGKPIVPSPWKHDASGQVQDFLEMTRGPTNYLNLFDPIAAARSALHEHKSRFGKDFEAVDLALQALRFLSVGTHCPELTWALQSEPTSAVRWTDIEAALYEANEVMSSNRLNDRQRLQTLQHLLVPTVMPMSRFRKVIFSGATFPFTMSVDKADKVQETLRQLYESEVPCKLKRNLP